jgi:hypothetical protein
VPVSTASEGPLAVGEKEDRLERVRVLRRLAHRLELDLLDLGRPGLGRQRGQPEGRQLAVLALELLLLFDLGERRVLGGGCHLIELAHVKLKLALLAAVWTPEMG